MQLLDNSATIYSVCCGGKDDQFIVSGGGINAKVYVHQINWINEECTNVFDFSIHTDFVYCVDINKLGTEIVSCSGDKSVILLKLAEKLNSM